MSKVSLTARRAILYARVSTVRQAENDLSISDQIAHAKSYCQNKGLNLIASYCDRGASAMDDNRPDFQRMIEDLKSGAEHADLILVHSFSRFFRDLLGSLTYRRQLERLGVKVVSMTQEVSSDDGLAETFLQLQAMMDENSSRENAKHVRRCMIANAERGYWNGSAPPFGYRAVFKERIGSKDKKVLEIAPEEAEIVRLIFDLYVRGEGRSGPLGIKAIAARLNDQGLRTRDGRRFRVQFIGKILRASVYVGRHYFNRTNSRTHEARPQEEWVALSVPPLIQEATFLATQEKLDLQHPLKTAPRVVNSPVLLTGIALCESCGRPMRLRTGKGGRYRYYACATRLESGAGQCAANAIPEKKLDDLVLDAFIDRVLEPKRLRQIVGALAARADQRSKAIADDIVRLHESEAKAKSKLKNLFALAASGVRMDSVLRDEIAKLQSETESLARQKAHRQGELSRPAAMPTIERIQAFRAIAIARLRDAAAPAFARAYIRLMIDRIEVGSREIRISGPKESLLQCVLEGELAGVRGFAQDWRARRDSNS